MKAHRQLIKVKKDIQKTAFVGIFFFIF